MYPLPFFLRRFFPLFSVVITHTTGVGAQSVDASTQASPPPYTLGGYAEAFYQWNFNNPSNGLTNFRGFDNRHNAITLANTALDAQWDHEDVVGRLTLQIGHTPSTYYLAEPVSPGANGANASDLELWKYLQQAHVGYRSNLGRGLVLLAGLFLSPIGPESMAVRDNWNWSRSNLFFGLPFYHTGLRALYPLTENWSAALAIYNGWNSVVDNNGEKSVSAQFTYTRPDLALSLLYFGGVERTAGAPEKRGARHLGDAHLTWHATPKLSFLVHGNAGLELTTFGLSYWAAGALYGRVQIQKLLYIAARADIFYEHAAESDRGSASPIFWPAPWVSSGTATVDIRPHERVSFRLEYRHDQAGGEMFFGGLVEGDGLTAAFKPNRRSQDTLTLGTTAWF